MNEAMRNERIKDWSNEAVKDGKTGTLRATKAMKATSKEGMNE